jgi:CO dehydrogenase maturation factor
MTYVIAVAGKGGVGKTTFSALTVRHLCDATGEIVLAVDADPNSNLGEKLGTSPGRTLGEIREEILSTGDEQPQGVSKQEQIDYQIRLALREGHGFDLLTMGRSEGPGCYCFVNNMLRTIMDSLADRYKYVVIDNEAGMEHLSRRTTRRSDVLFVIHDGSKASLEASKRISILSDEMKIKIGRKVLVCNLMSAGPETSSIPELPGFDAAYGIRRSGMIQAKMVDTESLMDIPTGDPAFSDVARIVDAERKRN